VSKLGLFFEPKGQKIANLIWLFLVDNTSLKTKKPPPYRSGFFIQNSKS
jgi:hypothetical protein